MKEMFHWVPWFTELAGRVAEGGEQYLNERAKRVDWGTAGHAQVEHKRRPAAAAILARESIDPLTFFAALAVRSKDESSGKSTFLSVGREFELSNSQLAGDSDAWDMPRSHHLFWDYDLGQSQHDLAWRMFRQATEGSVDPRTFDDAQALENIALPTLSSVLFLISPRSFLPLLRPPEYLRAYRLSSVMQKTSWESYSSEIKRIEADYPGCELSEIELFPRLQRPKEDGGRNLLLRTDRCWLVSTRLGEPGKRQDHWSDNFEPNNWVQTGQEYEGLADAATGDIVLARCGVTAGRGIGVVLENGYGQDWTSEDAIHVLWLNKMPAKLRTAAIAAATPTQQTRREAFALASANEQELFRACPEYRSTWRLLDQIVYCREVEVALNADDGQLGEVWRLRKAGTKISRIREKMGNAHTIRQIHRLLLKDRVPQAPTIRKAAASAISRFARVHKDGLSPQSQAKLDELMSKCGASSSSDSQYLDSEDHHPPERSKPRQRPDVPHDRNQILYGPPGTGKTYGTVGLALAIVDGTNLKADISDEDKQRFRSLSFETGDDSKDRPENWIAMVTFHQNYAYEDFVEGIRPRLAEPDHRDGDAEAAETSPSSELGYELWPGIFRRICEAAETERLTAEDEAREPKRFVLIIDEINRGNIPKIFGELITLIEPSRRLGADDETTVTLPYSGDNFGVPDNLYIIGTMNTADRSIQQMDTALRRRFTFVEMMPDANHDLISENVDGVNCRKMLEAMNERIALLLDREHQIGHTYLMNVTTMDQLADTCRNRIFPLLQEYFYDDWRKIRAVLGQNAFVQEHKTGDGYTSALAEELGVVGMQDATYERLGFSRKEWKDAGEYRKIYEEADRA